MYDCHYDLLTFIYMNKDNLNKVKEHCGKIFKENIEGGIFNLFYMSPEEMKKELGVEGEEINIKQDLKQVIKIIKENNLIPHNIDYKIGIEGLDYLEQLEDIEELYKLGVRSVNPVWNNHNKFGTGVRPIEKLNLKKGLTKQGKELIKRLINTKIAIDVSHCDEETFWDIIKLCRKYKKLKPKIWASHSNCKALCDVPRNLTDEQIVAIAELGGIIGVVEIKKFCSKDEKANFEKEYIKHIIHIRNLLGTVNNIALATDDMSYYQIEPEYYQSLNIFKHQEVNKQITKLLKQNNFTKKEIEKIKMENYTKFW